MVPGSPQCNLNLVPLLLGTFHSNWFLVLVSLISSWFLVPGSCQSDLFLVPGSFVSTWTVVSVGGENRSWSHGPHCWSVCLSVTLHCPAPPALLVSLIGYGSMVFDSLAPPPWLHLPLFIRVLMV